MLALLIPDGRDGNKGWGHSALCEAQEKSDCCKASETLRCSKAHADDTPQDHCNTNELGKMKLRHQVDEGELCYELPDIKD